VPRLDPFADKYASVSRSRRICSRSDGSRYSPHHRHLDASCWIDSEQNGHLREGGSGSGGGADTGSGAGAAVCTTTGTSIFVPHELHLPALPAAESGTASVFLHEGQVTRIGILRGSVLTQGGGSRSNVPARAPIVDRLRVSFNTKRRPRRVCHHPTRTTDVGAGGTKAMAVTPQTALARLCFSISQPPSAAIGSHATGESGRLAFYRPLLGQEAPLS
jgi:hypothetical protein